MKKCKIRLICLLAVLLVPATCIRAAEPPAESIELLGKIHGSIKFSATGYGSPSYVSSKKEYMQIPENALYWNSLKGLGELAVDPSNKTWQSTLNDLDKEIVKIALDYQKNPEKPKELFGWYAGSMFAVPKYLLQQENKNFSDEDYERRIHPKLFRRVTPSESLKRRHLGPDYRLAWETWVLAPDCSGRKKMLTGVACEALIACGTEDSIPVLMAFAELVDEKTPRPDKYKNGLDAVLRVLLHLKTEKSIRAALRIMHIASERDLPISGYSPASDAAKTRLEANRISIIEDLSGYCDMPIPEAPNLIHEDGRRFLPAVEALLKGKDLAEGDRKVLQEARGKILKHAPPLPPPGAKPKKE